MKSDGWIEIGEPDARQQTFSQRLATAREVWALHPDKTRMNDAQRLKLILVLINLQMSFVIDVGFEGENRASDHYVAYLCMLLSVAATGFRSELYPDILGPDKLPGVGPERFIDHGND